MELNFEKYCGSGNDFIIIDNRNFKKMIKNRAEFSINYCKRGLSIGADGVIFIENSSISDYKMVLFQPDGSEAEMCGNGARCVAKYAYLNGMADKDQKFETLAGIIEAYIIDEDVKVKLTSPENLKLNQKIEFDGQIFNYDFINTGVPHTIIFNDNIDNIDIKSIGRKIRFHKDFGKPGTNVNFVQVVSKNEIKIRTYERGVEDETLACGTGSTAAGLIAGIENNFDSPVIVHTKSGLDLKIHFNKEALAKKDMDNINLFLEGNAEKVYEAKLNVPEKYYNN
jgi:diaminopimelate epimerase